MVSCTFVLCSIALWQSLFRWIVKYINLNKYIASQACVQYTQELLWTTWLRSKLVQACLAWNVLSIAVCTTHTCLPISAPPAQSCSILLWFICLPLVWSWWKIHDNESSTWSYLKVSHPEFQHFTTHVRHHSLSLIYSSIVSYPLHD